MHKFKQPIHMHASTQKEETKDKCLHLQTHHQLQPHTCKHERTTREQGKAKRHVKETRFTSYLEGRATLWSR